MLYVKETMRVKIPAAGEKPTLRIIHLGDAAIIAFVRPDGETHLSVYPGPRTELGVYGREGERHEGEPPVTVWEALPAEPLEAST